MLFFTTEAAACLLGKLPSLGFLSQKKTAENPVEHCFIYLTLFKNDGLISPPPPPRVFIKLCLVKHEREGAMNATVEDS